MAHTPANHRVRVRFMCRGGHDHELCVQIRREVHPDLRCEAQQSDGYGYSSGGTGCTLPAELPELVERELRDHFQESRRRGWVLIAA